MKPFLSPLLAALFLSAACTAPTDAASEEVGEDALTSAKPVALRYTQRAEGGTTAVIDVKTPAAPVRREVVVHYKGVDNRWADAAAKVLSVKNGHELWSVAGLRTDELAIRYTEGDRTFWDNNDRRNYGPSDVGPGVDLVVAGVTVVEYLGRGDALDIDVVARSGVGNVRAVYTQNGNTSTQYAETNRGEPHWRILAPIRTAVNAPFSVRFSVVADKGARSVYDDNYRKQFECHGRGVQGQGGDGTWSCSGDQLVPR